MSLQLQKLLQLDSTERQTANMLETTTDLKRCENVLVVLDILAATKHVKKTLKFLQKKTI